MGLTKFDIVSVSQVSPTTVDVVNNIYHTVYNELISYIVFRFLQFTWMNKLNSDVCRICYKFGMNVQQQGTMF